MPDPHVNGLSRFKAGQVPLRADRMVQGEGEIPHVQYGMNVRHQEDFRLAREERAPGAPR